MEEKKCDVVFYLGLGEEEVCGKPAAAIVDAGTPNEHFVCQECKDGCHPSRLTTIAAAARGKRLAEGEWTNNDAR